MDFLKDSCYQRFALELITSFHSGFWVLTNSPAW